MEGGGGWAYEVGGERIFSLCVGSLPGRKSPALYVYETGNMHSVVRSLAYFKDEASAQAAMKLLDLLMRAGS